MSKAYSSMAFVCVRHCNTLAASFAVASLVSCLVLRGLHGVNVYGVSLLEQSALSVSLALLAVGPLRSRLATPFQSMCAGGSLAMAHPALYVSTGGAVDIYRVAMACCIAAGLMSAWHVTAVVLSGQPLAAACLVLSLSSPWLVAVLVLFLGIPYTFMMTIMPVLLGMASIQTNKGSSYA